MLVMAGRPAGTTVNGIVSFSGFYPTLLDGLSLEQPVSAARLAGHSLIPALRDGHSPQDEFVIDYGYGKERWLCLRGPRYKYTYWLAEGFEELYDLRADPGEIDNLARGAHRTPQNDVIARLMRERLEVGAP